MTGLGLMRWTSDAELVRSENEAAMQEENLRRKMDIESGLSAHIRKAWEQNKQQ